MPPTIDELCWLHASNGIDLSTPPSQRCSLSTTCTESQRTSGLAPATYTKPVALDIPAQADRTKDVNKPFHFRRTLHTPASEPPSPTSHEPDVLQRSPPVVKSSSPPRTLSTTRSHSKPNLPPTPRCHSRRAVEMSSCQEWIYRRPNKSPSHSRTHSPTTTYGRPRNRHSVGHSKSTSRPRMDVPLTEVGQLPAPFWSNILRPRSRFERSVPSLKAAPCRAQLVISPPFTPLPTISSSPNENTSLSSKDTSHARTPSITSSTSSASTASTSRPGTPVTPSPSCQLNATGVRVIPHRLANDPYHNRQKTKDFECHPLSASCPPSKSILSRTSSLSTRGSHTPSTTSGSATSVNKSVKFAEIPTVHYATRGHWEPETKTGTRVDVGLHDLTMGIDVEGMDMENDGNFRCQDLFRKRANEPENMRETFCSTPTPETERERTTGLKRFVSLTRRTPGTSCRMPGRPMISGPFVLGTVHVRHFSDSYSPAPSQSSITTPSYSWKYPQVPLRSDLPSTGSHLRSAPSFESFKSSRSVGSRSIRSLGSVRSTASTRGFRAWLDRMGSRLGVGPNISTNYSVL
ncbi:hypothetical protein AMATHDRAFT_263 [Amanita thiersii Skay4041]|uniref:Uncharacterized protein n=1 Tax=Amanita thiersii Skay4041 TaxID=703135 RepID=A0A2A9P0R8_9AGAR|nr:hypothetical protein AMATHDRAFT_263 [Amanita thiersii Skay4041]